MPELLLTRTVVRHMEATGYRKRAEAQAVVRGRGSGQVIVNGLPLLHYLPRDGGRSGNQDVAQVMSYPHCRWPACSTSVDVEATVLYDGPTQRYHAKPRRRHRRRTSVSAEPWKRPHPVQAPSSGGRCAARRGARLRSSSTRTCTRRCGSLVSTRDVRNESATKPGKKGSRKGRTWKKR